MDQDNNEWIDVSIPPENDCRYVVWVDGAEDYCLYCDDGYWCKDYGHVSLTGRVTHYRDRPEPPTTNKG